MWLSWRREAKHIEPSCTATPRLMELKIAKEILCEIFHARPADVEDMIQRRLAENGWTVEQTSLPDEGCGLRRSIW